MIALASLQTALALVIIYSIRRRYVNDDVVGLINFSSFMQFVLAAIVLLRIVAPHWHSALLELSPLLLIVLIITVILLTSVDP